MKKLLIAVWIICLTAGSALCLKREFDFMGLYLGMTQDEATNVISLSSNLHIDESRFFGKINESVPFIIKATYYPFIDNIYIQFNDNAAYGITIQFNPGYFDFLSLSEKLEDKYGVPTQKTSRLVLWEGLLTNTNSSSDIKLRLEYPTTVKVFDVSAMKAVNSELSQTIVRITNESMIQSNRRALLDEL